MSQTPQPPLRAPLAVVGAGAWGTVLACLLAENAHPVALWARRLEQASALGRDRENRRYVPGLTFPASLRVTDRLDDALAGVEAAFLAVPSKGLRATLPHLPSVPALVSCAKGLEVGTFKRLSEVIHEVHPETRVAALSGPNLAKEIAHGLPAAATVASRDDALAQRVQRWLNRPTFRVYTSRDIVGVEVAGAMKNVIALAAGMCDGLGLGDNARAAIITRGLAEVVRLGRHLGGETHTFYGLAGLGDMMATCSSAQSRNHQAGERLARGATLADLEASQLTAEGIPTVRAVAEYARVAGLELPISQEIYRVVYEGKASERALHDLMTREIKPE